MPTPEHPELLDMLLQGSPLGIGLVDSSFRFVRVNGALAALHGLPVADHAGRPVAAVVPGLWPGLEPILRRVLGGETVVNHSLSFARRDEACLRRLLVSCSPVRRDGDIIGVGIMVNDVTELAAAENAVRVRSDLYAMLALTNRAVATSRDRSELFQQLCSVAVETGHFRFAWCGVPEGDQLRLAASAGDDGGYMAELERSGRMITLDETDPRSQGPTGQAMLHGLVSVINDYFATSMTAPWHDAASRAGFRSAAAFPIREGGEVVAVFTLYAPETGFFTDDLVATLREVTPTLSIAMDRFAMERAGAAQQAQLLLQARALRAATQGIVITDALGPDNPLIYVSPAFERLTGYPASELLGRDCRMLQGPDTDRRVVAQLRAAIDAGRSCSVELVNYRKDGQPFWNGLAISPVRDDAGQITHYVGVMAEVSERREMERRLRQAQKMEAVGQLAGGVAHDFNNVLTLIRGSAAVALGALGEEPAAQQVHEIDAAAEHAAELTRQLLAFSRQQVLEPQPTDLNLVVRQTLALAGRLLGETIAVHERLASALPAVLVDRSQLQQVILNLAINARDAMPGGGTITVQTDSREIVDEARLDHLEPSPGRYARLQITDSGEGMDEATQSQVFDPFFTTKAEGTGLGLATVYGIVKQSGGHISVYSEPETGTTFQVYLPITDALPAPDSCTQEAEGAPGETAAEPEAARGEPDTPPGGTATILHVEDSAPLRRLIAQVLAPQGYRVLAAADAEEALGIAARFPERIDLLLTDIVMPGINGRELADRLRASRPEMKLLFTSGYPVDMVIPPGDDDASAAFVQKPFLPDELTAKVRAVLGASGA